MSKTLLEKIKVMQHKADGGDVQIYDGGVWKRVTNPGWDWHNEDYRRAGIPTFPSAYGNNRTRFIIAAASIGAAVSIFLGFTALGMAQGYLGLLIILIVIMFGLAVWSVIRPSDKINFRLFMYASLYMLSAMLLLMIGVLQF